MEQRIEVGNKVEWTETKMKGKFISMTQRFGKVLSVENSVATIQMVRKKITQKRVESLHVSGTGKNQLTTLMEKMGTR